MARLCERPGCSQTAEVMYGIDAEHLVVWIQSLEGAVTYRAGVLCRRHADAMVVPLGWMLADGREAVPRLFKPREAPAPAVPRTRRPRSHVSRDDTGQLTLPAVEPPARNERERPQPVAASVSAADETTPGGPGADGEPLPWKPVFDQRDDLDGLLTARSPLLSRAFGKREKPDG